MEKIYLVAGIDTGVGKTVATGLMARSLRDRGIDAITVKLVQTGNDGYSEDIDAHRAIMGCRFPEDDQGLTAPQIFKFPSSPELAARLEGRTVDLDRIRECVRSCAERHEVVLVEAAGGLHVPLTRDLLTIDFAAKEGWPMILVTSGRLGSINHTLLSLEAARSRGMKVAGVVYNWSAETDPTIDQDTPEMTRLWLSRWNLPPVVVRLPHISDTDPASGADFSPLFPIP